MRPPSMSCKQRLRRSLAGLVVAALTMHGPVEIALSTCAVVVYATPQMVVAQSQSRSSGGYTRPGGSSKRTPSFPEVATAEEEGFKGLDISAWNAIYLPKSATPQQVAKLNAALNKALDNPALKKRLEDIGLDVPAPERRTPEYLAKFTADEIRRWEAPVKASGVQFD